MAEQRAVIYLRGTDEGQLSDAENRCDEYAERFGWQVLESVRDYTDATNLDDLLARVSQLGIQIILTGSLDMISLDQEIRDDLMMTIERQHQCILHPVEVPSRP